MESFESQNFIHAGPSHAGMRIGKGHDTAKVDEAQIWKSFKEGNESAFAYIYTTYFYKLLNIGYQLSRDKSLIKDCIQDLFIDIRIKRKKLADVKSIKLYLYKSFRRRMADYLQYEMKKVDKERQAANEHYLIDIPYEDRLINSQLLEIQKIKLNKGIMALTEREREAIYFFYYKNLSYKEICDLFNYKQVKTVRNLVYQALKKLKPYIEIVLIFSCIINN